MKPCEVCLDLNSQVEANRWQFGIRHDLVVEYTLAFNCVRLKASAKSGCPICSTIWSGFELIIHDRRLHYFVAVDGQQQHQGRLILQPDRSLEVELFDTDRASHPTIRLQYYTVEGSLPVFTVEAPTLTYMIRSPRNPMECFRHR